MGHHRAEIGDHLVNARPALLLGFMQTLSVHQNCTVALQHAADHKFRNEHGRLLLACKLGPEGRPTLRCETGLKIQPADAEDAASTKKGPPKGNPYIGDALALHAAGDIK